MRSSLFAVAIGNDVVVDLLCLRWDQVVGRNNGALVVVGLGPNHLAGLVHIHATHLGSVGLAVEVRELPGLDREVVAFRVPAPKV